MKNQNLDKLGKNTEKIIQNDDKKQEKN